MCEDDLDKNDENKNDFVKSESEEDTDDGEDPSRIWFRSGRSRAGRDPPCWIHDSKSKSRSKKKKKLNGSRKYKYFFGSNKKTVDGNNLKEFDMIHASTKTKRNPNNNFYYKNLKIRIAKNRIIAREKHVKKTLKYK